MNIDCSTIDIATSIEPQCVTKEQRIVPASGRLIHKQDASAIVA